MDKFGRNYELRIENNVGQILTITLPFTIEFDITRNTLSSANVCQVRIYNLSAYNRNSLLYNVSDYGIYRAIELKAGYGDDLGVIFKGNISQCWSMREGVNFITQIECYDGGFAYNNGVLNLNIPAGTTKDVAFRSIVASGLPRVSPGVIGNFLSSISRSTAFNGNTAEILDSETGGAFFIDNEKANILKTNEYIASPGSLLVINAQSGLLGTPLLEQNIARFETLFEPKLEVGRLVLIDSATDQNFNGQYKVTAIKHRGMISEAVCGSVVTTGEFFFSKLLEPVS